MCVQDLAYCIYCGFERTMHFQRCKHWIKALAAYHRAYPSDCLSKAPYPRAQDCGHLSRNLRMAIRPGACPRGPPPPREAATGEGQNGGQTCDGEGCRGYEAETQLKAMGRGEWETTWGHRILRWETGLQQVEFMTHRADDMPGALEVLKRSNSRMGRRQGTGLLAKEDNVMRRAQGTEPALPPPPPPDSSGVASSPTMKFLKKPQTTHAVTAESVTGQIAGEQKTRRVQWAGAAQRTTDKTRTEPEDQFEEDSTAPSDQLAALGVKVRTILAGHVSYIDREKGRIRGMMDQHVDRQREKATTTRSAGPKRVRHYNGPMERPSRHTLGDTGAPVILACALHKKGAMSKDRQAALRGLGCVI
ncbi:predicted protein [Verticillium alfalfae VaMs.102]|uniref:Predicted protein n=1 Tax=Verticillium alfalfae (strain VaMs.102 / ATCC MYA-4576 / FGSC 10136) TaxID=526221 RepID=C9SQW1_VERA1|nr:predicted protein [Verticillium alfalfae VaMs.102]EEY21236.1 predicted protein [Verticillium alfalfae VaMs.102]